MKVKTHKFRLGTYHIDEDIVEGLCDIPTKNPPLCMLIWPGRSFKAFSSALHEAMHAEGIPDKYLHDKDGSSDTERIARFLWRLGYRRKR